MTKHFIIIALLCAMTCHADENRKPSLGMWAWKQSHFATAKARKDMLDFCEQEGISHIDQHISIKNGAIQNPDALRQLAAEATKRSITVNALRGSGTMFFKANHERTMMDIKSILEFNRALPKNAKLTGIKFDVEPYLTREWKAGGEQRNKVILDYLNFLTKARAYLKENASNLELAVDVPFWWDKPSYEIDFGGKRKLFVHHIQDIVNWVGLMSYRRDPATTIRLVQKEIDYASATGLLRSVAPAMETSKVSGKEAYISFGGVPPEQFRTALASIRATLAGNPQIRCIMLHHYGSLSAYLKNNSQQGTEGDE